MSLPGLELLRTALFAPADCRRFTSADWDLLIRQARQSGLLARIAARSKAAGCHVDIPAGPRMHLDSAAIMATRQQRELLWEVDQLAAALRPLGIPLVLLKGAAYAAAGLNAGIGRLVSDIDILVPHTRIGDVESQLLKQGWTSNNRNAYDQHYYRTWMHEIPPLRHIHRGTVVDVHHAILPRSARLKPDTALLLAAVSPLPDRPDLAVLAPEDMLLHSATHLFHEGELERGLRDLVDLDSLLRQFGGNERFWQRLVPRAVALDLTRPLFYALRYSHTLLGTPIPATLLQSATHAPGGSASGIPLRFMDALFQRALRPAHPSTADRWTPLARWLLYVRSHWLKMPASLLLPHLARKAFMRLNHTDS